MAVAVKYRSLGARDIALRMICSNDIKNRELQSDCETAKRHKKSIDPWAVNRLNSVHGFNIKMSIEDKDFDEKEIFTAMDRIENPTIIYEAKQSKTFNIKANEYLGNIRNELLISFLTQRYSEASLRVTGP